MKGWLAIWDCKIYKEESRTLRLTTDSAVKVLNSSLESYHHFFFLSVKLVLVVLCKQSYLYGMELTMLKGFKVRRENQEMVCCVVKKKCVTFRRWYNLDWIRVEIKHICLSWHSKLVGLLISKEKIIFFFWFERINGLFL